MSHSLVSIICPLHNKGRYVDKTIRSVLEQTCQSWEMLVVENESTDDGPNLVRQVEDPRVKLIEAPVSVRGPGAARNIGLDNAVGEWILFLDADDLIEPNHLESLLAAAMEFGTSIAASGWREFKESHPDAFEIKQPMGRGSTDFHLADQAIAFAPWAVHCALVRKELLENDIRWVEELDQYVSEDTAFWFKVVFNNNVAYTDTNSAVYRSETENYRNQFDDIDRWFEAMEAVINQNVAFLKSRDLQPNAKQAENLMRLWADVAERADAAGNVEVLNKATVNAQRWLDDCSRLGGVNTMPLRLRNWLGIKAFRNLRNLAHLTK